jgi:nitrilase
VWLDRIATTDKLHWIARVGAAGARIVAFGEALLPGYPFWVEYTDGARLESELQKSPYAHYAGEAVQIARGDLVPICAAAHRARLWVALGTIERDVRRGHSYSAHWY